MAFAPSLARKWYENLSVEELEEKYEELKKSYCFETIEEELDYIFSHRLDASNDANKNSTKVALEELLKEKTGKEYKIEPKKFELHLNDVINYVVNKDGDTTLTDTLTSYFQKLDNVDDSEKMSFLRDIFIDEEEFKNFKEEIKQTRNAQETYEKYKKIAREFISRNMRKA